VLKLVIGPFTRRHGTRWGGSARRPMSRRCGRLRRL